MYSASCINHSSGRKRKISHVSLVGLSPPSVAKWHAFQTEPTMTLSSAVQHSKCCVVCCTMDQFMCAASCECRRVRSGTTVSR